MIIKNFIPLTASLCAIAVDASEHDHYSIPSSCSFQDGTLVSGEKNATMITEPHKYFPAQIKRRVAAADAISAAAIDLPVNHSYPVIDISPWLDPSMSSEEDREHVVQQVLSEATTSGSFNIIGHSIDDALFGRLDASARNFFSMSLEQKMGYASGNNLAGYVANRNESVAAVHNSGSSSEQKDLREIFSMSSTPDNGANVQGPPDLQVTMSRYLEHLLHVEKAVKQIFTAALNTAKGIDLPPTYLKDLEGDETGVLRVASYPNTPGFDDATKLLPHSDFGTITMISSSEKGLDEIRDGRWYRVPIRKGEIHVNVGETYTMWSNGLFNNNIHRVSKEAKKDRISFSYFTSQGRRTSSEDNTHFAVSPICSDDEEPRFPRVSTIGHLRSYISAFTGGKEDLWDD